MRPRNMENSRRSNTTAVPVPVPVANRSSTMFSSFTTWIFCRRNNSTRPIPNFRPFHTILLVAGIDIRTIQNTLGGLLVSRLRTTNESMDIQTPFGDGMLRFVSNNVKLFVVFDSFCFGSRIVSYSSFYVCSSHSCSCSCL